MADHDALFKRAFSLPENAAGELRSVLPEAVLEALDLGQMRLVPGSFVDADMADRHTDLLFRAPLRVSGNDEAYVYLLLEHQSQPDRLMAYRVLVYQMRIWAEVMRAKPDRRALPPVVTVVVHHGPAGWRAPRRLHQLIDGLDACPALEPFVPDFKLLIDDLVMVSNAELKSRPLPPLPKVAVWLLRDARQLDAFVAHLLEWAGELEALAKQPGHEDMWLVLRYILRVAGDGTYQTIRERVREVAPGAEEAMTRFERELIQQGVQQGIEQGVQQGIPQGRHAALHDVLLRLLEQRFGELEGPFRDRIEHAATAELESWVERVLAAQSLRDLFKD